MISYLVILDNWRHKRNAYFNLLKMKTVEISRLDSL